MVNIGEKKTYPKKIITCEDSIESPNPSVQEKEERKKEWHVLHTPSRYHSFLKMTHNKYIRNVHHKSPSVYENSQI